MAISQRTRTLGTAGSGAGFTVGFPTGAATGDLVILCVVNAGTASPAAPTGWTRFYSASAGSGQNFAVYSAPWSSGLTGNFTNAASAAAWACNCFLSDSAAGDQIDVDAFTAATNTTNNTTLAVGNPTVGGIGGCYEVLCYGWTSTGTITTAAAGTTIDGTQAGTAISAAIGHNNTTSIAAGTTLALGNATLSGANTRKTGVGVILRDSRGVSRIATSVTVSLQETRRKARVSWVTLDIPDPAVVKTATPITVSLLATFTRTAAPVTVSLATTAFTRTATPVTAALSTSAITRTATPVTVALSSSGVRRSATPLTVALSASGLTRTATPVTVALSSSGLTRTATPVTASVSPSSSGTPRRARVSYVHLELPDTPAALIRTASPVTVALRGTATRSSTSVTASLSGATPFIAAAATGGRYMLDQLGQPIFIQGDSPQTMLSHFTQTEMSSFFSGQASRGYNASQIHLILSDVGGMTGNSGGVDLAGNAPFTNMATLSGPVAAYWNNVDAMLTLAEQNGISVFCGIPDNISMGVTIEGMTLAQCNTLGQFLGNRYKNRPNIIWVFGNDYQPAVYAARDPRYREILAGIRTTGDTHMVTTWLDLNTTSWDIPEWDTLHALILQYTYSTTYAQAERAWLDTSPTAPKPSFFGEGNYEYEHLNVFNSITVTTNETLRRTAWWPVTWGACGQFFGQQPVWKGETFGGTGDPSHYWPGAVTSVAAQQNWKVAELLRSLPWWNLQPDFSHTLITSGFGTHDTGLFTDPLANDFATAAITTDRHLAVIYVPTVRSWVIETTALIGGVTGFWFDPTTGTRTTATSPFTIPATAHADGTHDWVLVLSSTSRTATPVTVALSLTVTPKTRTATPVTVALSATPQRLASPVNASLQGASTRVSSPITTALAASNLVRTATPTSVALATIGTRASSPVTAALAASGVRRTATPVSATLLSQFSRAAQPVGVALGATNAVRTATPVTVSVSAFRVASPVTVSLLAIRTASPVTASLSTVLLNRTASPVTVALSGSGLTRPATPVTAALQSQVIGRTATSVTVALSASLARTGSPVTVALSGAATARLATPISVALQQQATRTATSVSVALGATASRLATPISVALARPRVASPVTVSLSQVARTRTAHPVTVALEREGELPTPARPLTVNGGRPFGTTVGGRGGLTVPKG